jgi:HNH endonuclease
MKLTIQERFLAKISRDADRGCWLWIGMTDPSGYGITHINRRKLGAHRAAWKLFRGEIARGLFVCHTCDVRACVNPEHLFLGTAADNAQDMIGKHRNPRGEKHPLAKLTAEQVSRIKAMLVEDRFYMTEIALQFGVSATAIWSIKSGKTWRHIQTCPVASPSTETA